MLMVQAKLWAPLEMNGVTEFVHSASYYLHVRCISVWALKRFRRLAAIAISLLSLAMSMIVAPKLTTSVWAGIIMPASINIACVT